MRRDARWPEGRPKQRVAAHLDTAPDERHLTALDDAELVLARGRGLTNVQLQDEGVRRGVLA